MSPFSEVLAPWCLRLLRVPPKPEAPFGAPGSERVFRAGWNYYRLRFWLWILRETAVFVVFLISVGAFHQFVRVASAELSENGPPAALRPADPDLEKFKGFVRESPPWIHGFALVLEAGAFVVFLVQLPFAYAMLRLDYEQRWYVVTDRSLRLRTGLVVVREMTMSFANIQQISVTQGPLQRLMGLADVRVESAGGGRPAYQQPPRGLSLHMGVFHAVDNAEEIRNLIVERLRLYRDTGLGEAAQSAHPSHAATAPTGHPAHPPGAVDRDAWSAAQELLQEAKALRAAAESATH